MSQNTPDSPPSPPNPSDISRIMQEQTQKLQNMQLSGRPLPTGRPLLLNRNQKQRTYWDSNQEGAFSTTKPKTDSDQLTIVGKIQRSKFHVQPEYQFEGDKLISLRTDRCLLTPLHYNNDQEIDLLMELFQNVELSRKIPAPLRDETLIDTREKALAFAKSHHGVMEKSGLLTISDKNTRMLIGVAGVWPVNVYKETKGRVADEEAFDENTMEHAYEIGFALVQKAWAKGLATESVLAIHHLMNRVALDKSKVYAYIDPKECRSQHVLEKIGMKRQEGTVEYRGEKGIVLYSF